MKVRAALPTEIPAVVSFIAAAAHTPGGLLGSVLPATLVPGALIGWRTLVPGVLRLGGRVQVQVEEDDGRLRAVALVYRGRRPEWVVLLLAADDGPAGVDGAFRLLSGLSADAARHGMHRIFGAVPDHSRAREPFFQAGFYSYTRETWFTRRESPASLPAQAPGRIAGGREAHDLFRFYAATTPHAVQRAEQLTVEDFDPGRRAGAFDPPHIGGNPVAMCRQTVVLVGDDRRPRGFSVGYRGTGRHPHVCKVRTAGGDVELARQLVRANAAGLGDGHPLAVPVRSYEEHIGRSLELEGFAEAATAMLFVKELAIRIEEPILAAVPAR